MSYLALYRKYRPQTFSEIVGQEAVVKALRNQVKYARIGHAYLFCGTHGTGKTTVARVFARAVNCLDPADGNPCGQCEFCKSASASLDIIEIDAASNTGVDNIRELREEVAYAPVAGRYKVYIIDEAHMLSAQAFNALLKTLEEPPEHVIFILATTEPQKILTTIQSRCQRYDFGRLSQAQILGQLKDISAREGLVIEEEALSYMASHVDGSSRDALSLLDQCRAYFTEEEITLSKVLDVLGAVDSSTLTGMTAALSQGDAASLLCYVDDVFRLGRDPLQLVASLAAYLRGVLLFSIMGPEANQYISDGPAAREAMAEQAGRVTSSQLTFFIAELSKLNNQIRFASDRRIILETGLVSIAGGRVGGSSEAALTARLDQLEAALNALKKEGARNVLPVREHADFAPAAREEHSDPVPVARRKQPDAAQPPQKAAADPGIRYSTAPSSSEPLGPSGLNLLLQRFTDKYYQMSIMKSCVLDRGDEPGQLVLRGNEFSLKLAVGLGNSNLHQLEDFIEQETGEKYSIVAGPPKTGSTASSAAEETPEAGKSMKELLGNLGGAIEWK